MSEEVEDIETVTAVIPYDGWSASLNNSQSSPSSSGHVENIDVTFVAIVETRIRHPPSQSTPLPALEGNLPTFDPNFVTPNRPINKEHQSQKTEYQHPTPPDYVDLYSFMTSMLSPPDVTPNRRLSFRDCSEPDQMRDGSVTSARSTHSTRSDALMDELEESLFELADTVDDYIAENPDGPSTPAPPAARRAELDRKLNALAEKFRGWDDGQETPVSPALARLTEANDRLEQMSQSAHGRSGTSVGTPVSSRSVVSSYSRPEHIIVEHPDEEDDDDTPGYNRQERSFNTSYERADDIMVLSPGLEEYTVRRKTFSVTPSGMIQEEQVDVEEGDEEFKESMQRVGAIWKKWAPKGLWERYQKRRRLRRRMKPIRIPEGVSSNERMELELQERTRRYNLLEYSSPHTKAKLMKIPYYRDATPLYNKKQERANYKQRDIGYFKNKNKDN